MQRSYRDVLIHFGGNNSHYIVYSSDHDKRKSYSLLSQKISFLGAKAKTDYALISINRYSETRQSRAKRHNILKAHCWSTLRIHISSKKKKKPVKLLEGRRKENVEEGQWLNWKMHMGRIQAGRGRVSVQNVFTPLDKTKILPRHFFLQSEQFNSGTDQHVISLKYNHS